MCLLSHIATSWGQHHISDDLYKMLHIQMWTRCYIRKEEALLSIKTCLYCIFKHEHDLWGSVSGQKQSENMQGKVWLGSQCGKNLNKMYWSSVTCYSLEVVRCPSATRSHPKETSLACTRRAHLLLPSPASGSSVDCERNLGQQLRQEQHIKACVCKRLTSPSLFSKLSKLPLILYLI